MIEQEKLEILLGFSDPEYNNNTFGLEMEIKKSIREYLAFYKEKALPMYEIFVNKILSLDTYEEYIYNNNCPAAKECELYDKPYSIALDIQNELYDHLTFKELKKNIVN